MNVLYNRVNLQARQISEVIHIQKNIEKEQSFTKFWN